MRSGIQLGTFIFSLFPWSTGHLARPNGRRVVAGVVTRKNQNQSFGRGRWAVVDGVFGSRGLGRRWKKASELASGIEERVEGRGQPIEFIPADNRGRDICRGHSKMVHRQNAVVVLALNANWTKIWWSSVRVQHEAGGGLEHSSSKRNPQVGSQPRIQRERRIVVRDLGVGRVLINPDRA